MSILFFEPANKYLFDAVVEKNDNVNATNLQVKMPRMNRVRDRALQENLAKKVAQSGGVKQFNELMIEAGYSPNQAKSPQQVLSKSTFQSLLEKYLPQDKVLNRHGQLVDSDNETIALGAVKLAHQVRGNFNEGTQVNNFVVSFENAPEAYETSDGETVDIKPHSDLVA